MAISAISSPKTRNRDLPQFSASWRCATGPTLGRDTPRGCDASVPGEAEGFCEHANSRNTAYTNTNTCIYIYRKRNTLVHIRY